MEKIVLNCEIRNGSEDLRVVKASKFVPWVVYWKSVENTTIKINNSDLLRAYRSSKDEVLEINVNWKSINVTFKEVQKNPITWDLIHVDFYAV